MTETITVTDVADMRAGDVVTVTDREGHSVTGEAWSDGDALRFGPFSYLLVPGGPRLSWLTGYTVTATREVEPLKPGLYAECGDQRPCDQHRIRVYERGPAMMFDGTGYATDVRDEHVLSVLRAGLADGSWVYCGGPE